MGTSGVRGQRQPQATCLHRRVPLRFQQAQQRKTTGVVVLAVLEAQVAAQHQGRVAAELARGDRQRRLDPALAEQQTLGRAGPLLVEGVPPVGTQSGADALQHRQRHPLRAEGLPGLAPVVDFLAGMRNLHRNSLRFCDRRQVEHRPVLWVLLGLLLEQPGGHVMVVPAGLHHHLRCREQGPIGCEAGFSAGEPDALEPVDQPFPLQGRLGVFWALVGVIDDPEVVALAGERTSHARSDAAAALGGEPVAHGCGILGEGMAGDPVVVPGFPAVGIGQLTRVAGDGAEQLRVPAHPVGREQARHQLAFSMAGRTADDQSRQLPVGHLLQQVDQQFGQPVELEAGEGAADEVAEQQCLSCRCHPVRIRDTQQPPVSPEVGGGIQQQATISRDAGCGPQGGGDATHQLFASGGLIGARSKPPISAITRKAPTAALN